MNRELLKEHIQKFVADSQRDPAKFEQDRRERADLVAYYGQFTKDRMVRMNEEEVYDYLSRLWAMLLWGNKHYMVDKILADNGLQGFRANLADLVWGEADITTRWDAFRSVAKGVGPAMMSEILCKTHPDDFMLWNRRAYMALNYLQVERLPRYDYQLTGARYKYLCAQCRIISEELRTAGLSDTSLLGVDYFIWNQLQVEEKLTNIRGKKAGTSAGADEAAEPEESKFIHNDVRDKLRDIGQWLGFTARIECKVSEGSKVDTIWEATIGNMGRVIYIFEVQTKGSIDSLMLNLLKSLNNPAVQGIVAVSDQLQLQLIQSHAKDVKELRDKLKYWDYEQVLRIHESLEFVNGCINTLGLVPQGF